jgi:hypothetical protein
VNPQNIRVSKLISGNFLIHITQHVCVFKFGKKDALVKKWKEATEESRQLVELLKKHNAGKKNLRI